MVEAPFAGPFYGPSDDRGPDKSPYVRGMKRGLSRWDDSVLPWREFDDHYNRATEAAAATFQHAHGLVPTGQWGRPSHEALERAFRNRGKTTPLEPALDATAVVLMEDGWALKNPPVVETPVAKVRSWISSYLVACEVNRWKIRYEQQRPMRSLGIDPSLGFEGDCSELAVAACYWARRRSGIFVPDPSGYGFSGYGNSDSLYAVNRGRRLPFSGPFQIGDVAVYGPAWKTRHVTICRTPGDAASAVFTSHGSEAGPLPTRLDYRRTIWGGTWGDLLAVVRPVLVP